MSTNTNDVEIFDDVVPNGTSVYDYIAKHESKSKPPKVGEYLYYDATEQNHDAQTRGGTLRRGSGNGIWREDRIDGCAKYVCKTDNSDSCGGDFSLPVNIDCKYSGWVNHGKLIEINHTHKDPSHSIF